MEYRIKSRIESYPVKYDLPFFTMDTRVTYMLQKKGWLLGWNTIETNHDKEKIEKLYNELINGFH